MLPAVLPTALPAATPSPTPTSATLDPPPAPTIGAAEVIHYRWRLEGLVGALAGLFLPSSGEGTLTTREVPGDGTETVLHITSPERRSEHWTYGSRLGDDGSLLQAWSSYTFRGESKQRETTGQAGTTDVAAAILRIRRRPPAAPERLEIWSEGKIYPVQIRPEGETTIRLAGGERRAVRHFVVQGLEEPGKRRWKGRLELWLASDPASTPVAIAVERGMARVRLLQVERPEGPPR
jgi:hypothetical protein